MKWLNDNRADAVGTWTSVNTSDPYFPPANLQNFLTAKVWRSGVAIAQERLLLDLGSTTAPGVDWHLILHGHNFDQVVSGAATILVEGHTSNSWGSPSFSHAIAAASWGVTVAGNGTAFLLIPASATGPGLRWWRISMLKNNATDLLQIGRAYIGPALDVGEPGQPDQNGLTRAYAELVNKDSSILGQVYTEQRAQFLRISGKVSVMTEATLDSLRAIWRLVGTWKPLFIIVVPEDWPTGTWSKPYYVRLGAPPQEQLKDYGASYQWDVPLSFEEQL